MRQLLGEFVGTFLRNRGAAAGLVVLALVGLAAAIARMAVESVTEGGDA